MIVACLALGNVKEDRVVAHVREVLVHDSWAHDVSAGPTAIESRVLTFSEAGTVTERIYDDTGIHDAAGSWSLDTSDGSVLLTLTGDQLRDRGRFIVTLEPKDAAIDLRSEAGGAPLCFQRRLRRV